MVLLGRIELPASPLPRVRSTTELQQPVPVGRRALLSACPPDVKPSLSLTVDKGKALRMSEHGKTNMSREERLAARLRENLRRRKAQARQISRQPGESGASGLPKDEQGS